MAVRPPKVAETDGSISFRCHRDDTVSLSCCPCAFVEDASGTLSRTSDTENFATASRIDRVVNRTRRRRRRSSLLTTPIRKSTSRGCFIIIIIDMFRVVETVKNYCKDHCSGGEIMTMKKKCNSGSNSFVAAAEQVCLQPVLEHRQRRGRRNIDWQAIPHLCCSKRKGTTSDS